jgi:hypothetical protein
LKEFTLDTSSLDVLLKNAHKKQFWLKPIGAPKWHKDWPLAESRKWTEDQVEIHFHDDPVKIAVGAIVIAYRIRYAKLIYVAERLPVNRWGKPEWRAPEWVKHFPYYIKATNLSPEFGGAWKRHNFKPFTLAKEYNILHPEDPASLGAIKFGADKVAIPQGFAELLIQLIRDA